MNKSLANSNLKSLCILLIAISFLISGCNITPVSEYDEQTDQTITQFHKDLTSFLNTLNSQKSPDCLAANHQEFYNKANTNLRALLIRAEAIPNNSLTAQSVTLLIDSIKALEMQHVSACLPSIVIDTNRSNLEIHIRAILKLELAKKRGE